MKKDTVFQHVLKPISDNLIERCVKKFDADYHYEKLKTHEHLQIMVCAQIQQIKSLRTLEVALNSQQIGIKINVRRSTLSDANAKRNANCFLWLLNELMSLLPRKKERKKIKELVRILDSSPIKLKGHGYDEWAKEHSTHHWQGLKLHTEYDLALRSPVKIATSYANYTDCSMAQHWSINENTMYVFDKGYCDYNWWWSIHQRKAYFITRLKNNAAITLIDRKEAVGENVVGDEIIKLNNKNPRGGKKNLYTENLRRISIKRKGKDPLVLVTNHLDYPAQTLSELYKARWEIELFFKWIKQNLRIKKFLGKTENAIKIQLITAIISYLLLQFLKWATDDSRSLQLILTWVSHNLAKQCALRKNKPPDLCLSQGSFVEGASYG